MFGLVCVVVMFELIVFDQKVDLVVVFLFDGEKGIVVNYVFLIGCFGFGELRLMNGL